MQLARVDSDFAAAAEAIRRADALLIGAGAGMGVDSGLPDFRGPEGFWRAYPPFRGRRFEEISTPHWFETDPGLAWGFFGHRLNLYRNTRPHAGFALLREWAERCPRGAFVFTSNVDGQFQKAGFAEEGIIECHGSIRFLQCTRECGGPIWPSAGLQVEVDEKAVRARGELPKCPRCGALARPNILMFGDGDWSPARYYEQQRRYREWLREASFGRLVAIELGAGLAIPTVRYECERRSDVLIRINPREPETAEGISLPCGAVEALRRIAELL